MKTARQLLRSSLLALGVMVAGAHANAETVTHDLSIDLSGVQSFSELSSPLNTVLTRFLNTDAHIIGLGWDVSMTAFAPSWLDDVKVRLSDSADSLPLDLRPGEGDQFAGTRSYGSGGIVDLTSLGYDFNVGNDGALRIEIYETLDDVPGADAVFNSGSSLVVRYETAVTSVPEPSTQILLLVGGVLMATRRVAARRTSKA